MMGFGSMWCNSREDRAIWEKISGGNLLTGLNEFCKERVNIRTSRALVPRLLI